MNAVAERPARRFAHLSDAQADFITNLVEARYAPDAPEREPLREQFRAIRSNADVSAMIEQLRAVPTLVSRNVAALRSVPAPTPARATAAGFYRNPATGELFRLSYGKDGAIISKYSVTGGPRRLVADLDKIEKGSWKRLNSIATRQTARHLQAAWLVDPKVLAQEYAYNFCPFHNGPLTDAVSVILGYGEKCAENNDLPWGESYAQAILDARKAN